jgi:hypothetical protein
MNAQSIVQILLETDPPPPAWRLIALAEASVHRPRRGKVYIASYRNEHGKQVQRTTGQRARAAAQAIADDWEAAARVQRAAQPAPPNKPIVRVRPGSAERAGGLLTQREVAMLLRISERAVRVIEQRAFDKIRNHPLLRQFWNEWRGRGLDEAGGPDGALSRLEMAALYSLARGPEELQVLRKVVLLMARPNPPS